MTPALRWAAVRAILMFHNCEGQSHKTVSTDHNFWRERRAEADSNRGHLLTTRPDWLTPILFSSSLHFIWLTLSFRLRGSLCLIILREATTAGSTCSSQGHNYICDSVSLWQCAFVTVCICHSVNCEYIISRHISSKHSMNIVFTKLNFFLSPPPPPPPQPNLQKKQDLLLFCFCCTVFWCVCVCAVCTESWKHTFKVCVST